MLVQGKQVLLLLEKVEEKKEDVNEEDVEEEAEVLAEKAWNE